MLIQWKEMRPYFSRSIKGVLHVGGHLAEELEIYNAANIKNVIWIEANKDRSEQIKKLVPDNHIVVNAIIGDISGKPVTFYEANNGQSSSILELGTHAKEHPEVHYVDETQSIMTRLDELSVENNFFPFNFINLDIQGAELLAIKGMGKLLDNVDYIYTEVNKRSLYKDCALINDLDEYLSDFNRVLTEWTQFGWGDAFYVRRKQ